MGERKRERERKKRKEMKRISKTRSEPALSQLLAVVLKGTNLIPHLLFAVIFDLITPVSYHVGCLVYPSYIKSVSMGKIAFF